MCSKAKTKIYLIVVLLTVLILPVGAEEQQHKDGRKIGEQTPDMREQGQDIVTGAKAWALGCAAILTERNHDRHDLLAGRLPVTKIIIEKKKIFLTNGGG